MLFFFFFVFKFSLSSNVEKNQQILQIYKIDAAITNRAELSTAYNETFATFKWQNGIFKTFDQFCQSTEMEVKTMGIATASNTILSEHLKLILTTNIEFSATESILRYNKKKKKTSIILFLLNFQIKFLQRRGSCSNYAIDFGQYC